MGVPCVPYTEQRTVSNGEEEVIERAKSTLKSKIILQTPLKQLRGIIPVVEDWHTKANVLGVR